MAIGWFLLLIRLLFGGGSVPPPVKCTTGCIQGFGVPSYAYTCFYRERPACDRFEFVCVDSNVVACRPVSVEIGMDSYRDSEGSTYYYEDSNRPVTDSHFFSDP